MLIMITMEANIWVLAAKFWNKEFYMRELTLSFQKSIIQCFSSVQFSSVAQSCPTLCDPVDCSTPGLLVHQQLQEFTQTHVHWVSDAIQPSHPLLSPSPALSLSQHQGLFKWVSCSHQVATVLEFRLQHQSFRWIPWTGWISLQPKGLSRVFSNTKVQKHQFFGTQLSLQPKSHIDTWPMEKRYPWLDGSLLTK